MKKILTFLFTCVAYSCYSQITKVDSLKREISIAKVDTNRVKILIELSSLYRLEYPDSCLVTAKQALDLAQSINFIKGEVQAIFYLGLANRDIGNYPQAFAFALKGLKIAKNHQYLFEIAQLNHLLGICYTDFKDYKKAILKLREAKKIEENLQQWRVFNDLSLAYILNNQIDSALYFATMSNQIAVQAKDKRGLVSSLRNLGRIQLALSNYDKALDYYWQSYRMWEKTNKVENKNGYKSYIYNLVGEIYLKTYKIDSCIYFAKEALIYTDVSGQSKRRAIESYNLLVEAYKKKKDFKQAFENLELLNETRESLFGASNTQAIQTLIAQDQEQEKQIEIDTIAYQSKLRQNVLLTGFGIMFLIGFILYRTNQKEKKAKKLLQEQKNKVESTLSQLKSTQTQLIQSEKLASLGELTAGIAHEIQNPLNFVNNFSELSVDLAKELKEEAEKPEIDKELIIELANDLSQNQEKINHHGKRASSIVKGMLEHSRASTGVKELTDINALADEYLRLAYHGLRAKDKDFNATLETHFDQNLPQIEVISQDIGRVLLNLINNAFYAVSNNIHVETLHATSLPTQSKYQPTIIISTQKIDNQVIIKIKDNGMGMNEATKAKIFQPFFTTKPTGQGTGLGLSLAYDIITKGHGGSLEVISTEGIGSEFIIKLSIV